MKVSLKTALLCSAFSCVLASPAVLADRIVSYDELDSEALIEALSPPDSGAGIQYRGVPEQTYRGLAIEPSEPDSPSAEEPDHATELPTVALNIQFAFDSADLTESARALLDEVAEAITSTTLSPYYFLLEGHTDSVGAAEYNQRLSERRALSVRRYLMQEHGIQSERLEFRGHGQRFPLVPDDPTDGVNRRVEITNVGRM